MATRKIKEEMSGLFLIVCVFITVCSGLDLKDKCGDKIAGCYCTDTYIDCNEAVLGDISEIYPYITNLTYSIHMTNGNIRSIPSEAFTNMNLAGPLSYVKYLNMSGNGIVTIHKDAFRQLPNLETLDLSNNDVYIDSCDVADDLANLLESLSKMKDLHLRKFIDKEAIGQCSPGFLFSSVSMNNLVSLDLSSNGFDLIDEPMEHFLCKTYTITSFNMSHNDFESFPVPTCMMNLVTLDLSYNRIFYLSHVDTDVIESLVNLKSILLGGNPFNCDCVLGDAIDWINKTGQPLDSEYMTCATSQNKSLIGKSLKGLEYFEFCEPEVSVCFGPGGPVVRIAKSKLVFIGVAVGAVVSIGLISATVIICRRRRNRHQGTTTTTKAGTDSHMTADVSKSTLYSRMV